MFVAYFKSLLVKNSTESRASISRRYEQLTYGIFVSSAKNRIYQMCN